MRVSVTLAQGRATIPGARESSLGRHARARPSASGGLVGRVGGMLAWAWPGLGPGALLPRRGG
eukprot:3393808-Alexandrium_andersonii.AAC.1